MATDLSRPGSSEPSTFRARVRNLVTLTAFVVGGASLLAVGIWPSEHGRADATNAAKQSKSGLNIGLTGECGIEEPDPVAQPGQEPAGSCGAAVVAPVGTALVAEPVREQSVAEVAEPVHLDAVGQCSVGRIAASLPATQLLTASF